MFGWSRNLAGFIALIVILALNSVPGGLGKVESPTGNSNHKLKKWSHSFNNDEKISGVGVNSTFSEEISPRANNKGFESYPYYYNGQMCTYSRGKVTCKARTRRDGGGGKGGGDLGGGEK